MLTIDSYKNIFKQVEDSSSPSIAQRPLRVLDVFVSLEVITNRIVLQMSTVCIKYIVCMRMRCSLDLPDLKKRLLIGFLLYKTQPNLMISLQSTARML